MHPFAAIDGVARLESLLPVVGGTCSVRCEPRGVLAAAFVVTITTAGGLTVEAWGGSLGEVFGRVAGEVAAKNRTPVCQPGTSG